MRPPADFCLAKLQSPLAHAPAGGKCTHDVTKGQWLVSWEGELYSIQPSSQLQKDIWLSEAKGQTGQDQVDKLRWFCHLCGNIQMP